MIIILIIVYVVNIVIIIHNLIIGKNIKLILYYDGLQIGFLSLHPSIYWSAKKVTPAIIIPNKIILIKDPLILGIYNIKNITVKVTIKGVK